MPIGIAQISTYEYEVVFGYDVLDAPQFDAAEWILWKDDQAAVCVAGRGIRPNLNLIVGEEIGVPTAISFTGLGPRVALAGYRGQIVSVEAFSQEF